MRVAKLMRAFHVLSIVVWTVMMPVSLATGLADSKRFISMLSIYALLYTAFVGVTSSRVEVGQREEEEGQ